MTEDRFARLRAEYDGPPPPPLDAIRARFREELGIEVTARYADYVYFEDGQAKVIPTTIVELPDGSVTQFFPKAPPPRQTERRAHD